MRTFVVDATSDYTLNVGTTADGIGPDGAIRVLGDCTRIGQFRLLRRILSVARVAVCQRLGCRNWSSGKHHEPKPQVERPLGAGGPVDGR